MLNYYRAAVLTAAYCLLTPLVAACTPAAPGEQTSSGRPISDVCRGAGSAAVGVFRQTDPAEVDAFEDWLGCRVDYAVDYSARDSWRNIADPSYLHRAWADQPRRLVLGVAMLPTNGDVDIAAGARGDYDKYFRELATNLVTDDQADAILRVGWEFNLSESTWFTKDADKFVAYWRRIVSTMSAVNGARFEFDWNPNNGRNPVDAVDYYPGDDVVDYVGIDAYDVGGPYPYPDRCDDSCRLDVQTRAWNDAIYGGSRGLGFWITFARQHGKPIALPEWGVWSRPDGIGGGENPYYIEQMHRVIVDPANNVAYQAYFEFDGADGEHRLMTTFPRSGEMFRSLFS
jgi:hypothetical protein